MEYQEFWDNETDIADLDINQPRWIAQTLSPHDMVAIYEGGCASGAYMPAVTYHQASSTMNDHGDEVLQFIEDHMGEVPQPPAGESWRGIAVFYLSCAVELWVYSHMDTVEAAIAEADQE